MTQKISVAVPGKQRDYDVIVGEHLAEELATFVQTKFAGAKIAIVTDATVKQKHLPALLTALADHNPVVVSIPAGEQSKTREFKLTIEDLLFENNFDRTSLVIALGGGVVTDLAGYVAATFLRGISVVHVPTTLLAMVDASIGGKTGINNKYGKNLIGSIWQPAAVFADVSYVKTLPEEEFTSGLAEVIKIATTSDADLFDYLEQHVESIQTHTADALQHIIVRAIELKKHIVESDETETGMRQVLNCGHTIGHALEKLSKYSIKHGYAVSHGICVETQVLVDKKILSNPDRSRITSLLGAFKLPTDIKGDLAAQEVHEATKSDKKTVHGVSRLVAVDGVGSVQITDNMPSIAVAESDIIRAVEACRARS